MMAGRHRKKSYAWLWLLAAIAMFALLMFLMTYHTSPQPAGISSTSISQTTTPASTTSTTVNSTVPTTTSAAPTTTVPPTTTAKVAPKTTVSTPARPVTTTTVAPVHDPTIEEQVINLTNQYRAQAGCTPVVENWLLMGQSQAHSQDQANVNTMFHSEGGVHGFSHWGENVAYGHNTPDEVMAAWMNSPGHRENILNCSFTQIGVGLATGSDANVYWTQQFGE